MPQADSDLHRLDPLDRIHRRRPREQLQLVAVGQAGSGPRLGPGRRVATGRVLRDGRGGGGDDVDREHERPARPERVVDPPQGQGVRRPAATDAERVAAHDRPVPARRGELVERALGKPSVHGQPVRLPHPSGRRKHVGGHVDAVHVQARLEQPDEQAARAAAEVQRGLPEALDRAAVVRQLLGKQRVDLRPPPGHQPVVPGRARGVEVGERFGHVHPWTVPRRLAGRHAGSSSGVAWNRFQPLQCSVARAGTSYGARPRRPRRP